MTDLADTAPDVPAGPGGDGAGPILRAHDIQKAFGGLVAVDAVDFEIPHRSIVSIIGPNGAGKTTFFNVVSGFDRPESGSWRFDGRELSRTPAYRIPRAGMVRTFQLTKALMKMRVIDNLKLAATGQRGERFFGALVPALWRRQEAQIQRRAEQLLDRFQLAHMRDQYAATLSGGQRKLLEMARGLMVDPSLIMLDEPMAGVNPALTQSLLAHVVRLRDDGMTVVFVEHDMDVVMEISDWVVCMAEGRIIAEGPPRSIGRNPAVIDAYLGGHHGEKAGQATGKNGA